MKPVERAAYSVEEFCEAYGVSKATLYREFKRGRGPRVMRVGRRVMVSLEAAEEWRLRMECEAA